MDAAKVVATYKSLARVERDFRSLKAIDLDLRPIHHWTETRVRAHVFICMLAAYLVWHLRQAWAPLTFTDEQRPDPADPVAPARRSQGADHKAATKTTTDDLPAAASPASWVTWPRSPATTYASPATTRPASTCSPYPPPPNAGHSNSSAPRSH